MKVLTSCSYFPYFKMYSIPCKVYEGGSVEESFVLVNCICFLVYVLYVAVLICTLSPLPFQTASRMGPSAQVSVEQKFKY